MGKWYAQGNKDHEVVQTFLFRRKIRLLASDEGFFALL